MKLIPLKCQFCGGRLARISSDTVACRFCNTAYLLHGDPVEPIVLPTEEPTVPEPPAPPVSKSEPDNEPCQAEKRILKRLAESEYQFWQSLPGHPKVQKRRGRLIVAASGHLAGPGLLTAFGSLVGAIAATYESTVLGWIMLVCFVAACALGFHRLAELHQTQRLVDNFVKQQTAMRNEIRDLHAHRELLERLP